MRKVLFLSASFFIFFGGCRKDGELDPDFIQRTSSSFFTDSVLIKANTVIGDSILADQIATGLVGTYQDSSFGSTVASLYIQPLLESNALTLADPGEQLLLDSIVLSLKYESFFGDTSVMQTISVLELDEVLSSETNYYSDTNIVVKPEVLATKEFFPKPTTSVIIHQPNSTGGIDTVSLEPQLRVRLSDSLGDRILAKSGKQELESNTDFINYFKGIKIIPHISGPLNNNEKAILYFALTSSETQMVIHYKLIDNQGDTTPMVLNFPINSSSVRFSTFENNFSLGAVQANLIDGKDDSSFSYVQAMAGVETVLRFPNIIERFEEEKIVVNKAELVLPVASGSYAKFGVATTLILASRDQDRILQFTPDFFESGGFLGGEYDADEGVYTFNIARYIQGVLNGTESPTGLTILVTGSAVKAERAVLLAPGNTSRKIKLNLFYSKTQ